MHSHQKDKREFTGQNKAKIISWRSLMALHNATGSTVIPALDALGTPALLQSESQSQMPECINHQETSMSQTIPSFPDFGKLVPGFDFLQNLTKQATSGQAQTVPQLPNLGNWIAPTLSVEELDKRIQELKSVQFWLDQNATALKATIQALEVQKMTLATLKGMNFNISEMANAFTLKTSESMAQMADQAKVFANLEIPSPLFQTAKAEIKEVKPEPKPQNQPEPEPTKAPVEANSMVDPMQWWGALTQQFQTIASEAMKDVANKTALDATTSMATGLAKDAVKTATDLAKDIAESATQTMTESARAALSSNWTATPTAATTPPANQKASAAAKKTAAPRAAAKTKAPADRSRKAS